MNNSKQETFSIKEQVNQTPFDSLSSQSFLKEWAKINDGMEITFLPRKEWEEKREEGIFQKKENGKMELSLPEDLHLWEMVGIMEEVDRDTFSENPKKANEKREEMALLGKKFKNVAQYLSERISSVREGRGIAEAMAEEFLSYGNLLSPEENSVKKELTAPEIAEADKWILGENIALSRLEKSEDEEKRKETLAQFFRVAEKAFVLRNRELQETEGKEKPWEDKTPIHSAFLQKVEQSIKGEVEKPKWEIEGSLFRRGTENLMKNLERPANKKMIGTVESFIKELFGEKAVSSFSEQNEKLADSLKISELKKEIEEVRGKGDLSSIGMKEREIALKIQKSVNDFPYRLGMNNPSDIIEKKYINCVGASIVGSTLLSEVGIDFLSAAAPEHSLTFLITTDGKVVWQDMLCPDFNQEIQDRDLDGINKKGTQITVSDILDFSKNPDSFGLSFNMRGEEYRKKLPFLDEGEKMRITLFLPKQGQQIELLNNTAFAFIELGKYKEAIETCKQGLSFSPNYPTLHYNYGYSLSHLGHFAEAIKEYKKGIAIYPEYYLAYEGIGYALLELGHISEAIETFEKAVSLRPKDSNSHLGLGVALLRSGASDVEAENEFKIAISLNDRLPEPYLQLAKLFEKTKRSEESSRAYKDYEARKK